MPPESFFEFREKLMAKPAPDGVFRIEALPKVTEFHTRLGADERLYAKYKAIAASPAAATLHPARRKALANALRDFVLSGAELQGEPPRRDLHC